MAENGKILVVDGGIIGQSNLRSSFPVTSNNLETNYERNSKLLTSASWTTGSTHGFPSSVLYAENRTIEAVEQR